MKEINFSLAQPKKNEQPAKECMHCYSSAVVLSAHCVDFNAISVDSHFPLYRFLTFSRSYSLKKQHIQWGGLFKM